MARTPTSRRRRLPSLPVAPGLLTVLTVAAGCGSTTSAVTHAPPADAAADTRVARSHEAGADGAQDASSETPVCTVRAGKAGVLIRGTLLLPSGPASGEVLVSSAGLIACAAPSCSSSSGYADATVVDCPTGVVSPALVNAHDHTEYATTSPEAHGTVRYDHRNDWRTGADGFSPLTSVSKSTDTATVAAQELRLIAGGATSVIGSGGVAGLARNLAAYRTPTDETEGLTGPTVYFDTFPLGDESGVVLTSGCAYPTVEPSTSAFAGGGKYAPHIAEGVELAAQNELACAEQASNDLVTSQTSVIHGVGMNAKDVATLQTAGASLIWAPRSNVSLYGDTTPVTELRYAGVPIALGTDWLPSGSMNMLRELACADSFNQKYLAGTFSDQDLFEMATIHGAAAAGFDKQIGSLEGGKLADIAIFDGARGAGYRAVLAASGEDVRLVMRGGKVLYGDAAVVGALTTQCTPWTVCGMSRMVCVDTPNIDLAAIESAASSIYALTSCRSAPPAGEPTCVPYRDTYPDGTSATDRDGDGVPDSQDDCPDVFNPVRLMDNGAQSDVDGDGYGDACDAYPLDPTKH